MQTEPISKITNEKKDKALKQLHKYREQGLPVHILKNLRTILYWKNTEVWKPTYKRPISKVS